MGSYENYIKAVLTAIPCQKIKTGEVRQMKLGTQKVIVLAAWGLTSLFLPLHWLGLPSFAKELMTFFELNAGIDNVFWWWLSTFFAATALALALGLKNAFLALPGLLWPPFSFLSVAFACKFSDSGPMYLSLLFFLFFATYVPLLIRSYKDERRQQKIYQGALLLMILSAATFLFLA
ncbi:MAG: hypothetical protein DDT19_00464 [Syntrophomonadaceae bacterium]|nr:hypothetical protein [Bacillota bacterium]